MTADLYIYFFVALAGLISFLSPCVLPLVPPYLGYLGGTTLDQMTEHEDGIATEVYQRVILSSVFFVLGFTTVFVMLGAGASFFGGLIHTYKNELGFAAGIIIILFGLHFIGLFKIPIFYREARYHVDTKPAGYVGAYVIGLAFAFGWTPCLGPVLATILTLAAQEGSVNAGVSTLLAYSLGLGVPFILAAVAIKPFLGFMQKFRRHLGTVEKVMGVLLVIAGLMFLTGSMNTFGNWLLETFPQLETIEGWVVPEGFQKDMMRWGKE